MTEIFDVIIGCNHGDGYLFLVTSLREWFKPTPESFIISECAKQLELSKEDLKYKRLEFEIEVKNVKLLDREEMKKP